MASALGRSILILLTIGLWPCAGRAELFVLDDGGRVEGKLLNPDQSPRETYQVKMASGVEITLDADLVKQKLHQRPVEVEYERLRPSYPDTVEGQWELAQWCLEQHLLTERKVHLERILELDPNHEEARRALNYSQVDGKWQTKEEVMLSRGYRWYKGRWRLPQEIELMERDNKVKTAEREWFAKLRMWRGWLGTSKEAQAQKNLMGIDDPYAVKAIASALDEEQSRDLRVLYIEILAKINSPDAIAALTTRSLEDPSLEMRLTCLDWLKKEKRPGVVAIFVKKLKSKDNIMVRRAAVGLSHMNDLSAVGPLVDALVTIHKYKITKGNGNPNQHSYSFGGGSSGGMPGFGFGGGGTQIIKVPKQNQEVLDALISLTGQNFQFNLPAWKAWYASQKKHATLDARRS